MKRVSFKIAKALKEAGYPQDIETVEYGYALNVFGYYNAPYDYDEQYHYHSTHVGDSLYFPEMCNFSDGCEYCVAPTYFEVWEWLWSHKNIKICVEQCGMFYINGVHKPNMPNNNYNSPQEAIKEAVEHIVNNNLIK